MPKLPRWTVAEVSGRYFSQPFNTFARREAIGSSENVKIIKQILATIEEASEMHSEE
jgi:hypothetical protein